MAKKRIISTFLILLVLTGSVGISVFKHTCHVFDRSEIVVFSDDCCVPKGESNETSVDWQCCSVQEFDTSVAFETTVEKAGPTSLVWIQPPYLVFEIARASVEKNALPATRPPPLANRDVHNHFQVYRL